MILKRTLCAAVFAIAGVTPASFAQTEAAPDPRMVLDHWAGQIVYSGSVIKGPSVGISGNSLSLGSLNFKTGSTEPFNSRSQVTVWIAEDGSVRAKGDQCTTALVSASGTDNVTLETGGRFREDFGLAGTPPDCGKNPGDVDVESWVDITPTESGLQMSTHLVRKTKTPSGRLEVKGAGLLKPVYRRVLPPHPPASEEAWAAANADGIVTVAEGIELRGLDFVVDSVIYLDSRGWLLNRYDRASVSNAHFLEKSDDGQSGWIYSDFTLNGGNRGWIKIKLSNGDVDCMEYWDARGSCRKAGSASYGSQAAIGFMVDAITAPRDTSIGDDGMTDKQRALQDTDRHLSDMAGRR